MTLLVAGGAEGTSVCSEGCVAARDVSFLSIGLSSTFGSLRSTSGGLCFILLKEP